MEYAPNFLDRRQLLNADEGGLCSLGAEALRPHHRLVVAGLQLEPLGLAAGALAGALSSTLCALMALPRYEIASRKAERRSASSPDLPHHSIAAGCLEVVGACTGKSV
jgi:hypothetical protein